MLHSFLLMPLRLTTTMGFLHVDVGSRSYWLLLADSAPCTLFSCMSSIEFHNFPLGVGQLPISHSSLRQSELFSNAAETARGLSPTTLVQVFVPTDIFVNRWPAHVDSFFFGCRAGQSVGRRKVSGRPE